MTTDPGPPDWTRTASHPDALHPAVPAEQSPAVYGVFLRPLQHRFPALARLLFLLILGGGGVAAWLVAQVQELLPADGIGTSAVLAGWMALVAATYYLLTRPGAEVGIELGDEMIRFGRWPDDVVEIHRADLIGASVAGRVWDGRPVEPALKSYLVRGFRYVTLRRKDGVLFHVAIDSANPYAERILDVLTGTSPLRRPQPPEPGARSDDDGAEDADSASDDGSARQRRSGSSATSRRGAVDETAFDAEKRLWEAANRRHDEVLLAYLPYEVDPYLLMQYPAMTDVTIDATAAFVDAIDEAGTLRTDMFPESEAASIAYRERVKALGIASSRAERNAKKIGVSQLDPGHRRKISQAARLLRHAEGSDNPFEQASYLQQVSRLIDELTRDGAICPPPRITAEIASRTTLALERADAEPTEPA